VVQLGGTNHNESWSLNNLPDGNYFWRVQAVDAAFAGSPFSAEGTFTVGPEIDVQRPAGTSVADGGTDNVGDQTVGTVNLTYTIANTTGTAQLNVTAITASNLTNCSSFMLNTTLPINVAAGATATFDISFDVDAVGAFSFDLDISNNDTDENPYDIQVTGNGISPTAIVLAAFSAEVDQDGILIHWTTATEANNAGFNIYRSQQENGDYVKINGTMIPGQGDAATGHSYSYTDRPDQAGTYYYKLEDIAINGQTTFHGPIQVTGVTSVAIDQMVIPDHFELSQNYPNPFNPETHIQFALPRDEQVRITIYDLQGQLVRTMVNERKSAGTYSVIWNGRDENGVKVSSGVYFYRIDAGEFTMTRKMILMK